jgi:hypothetical protein
MNCETDFTAAAANGQIVFPDPDCCLFWERDDGSFWMAGEIDGVFHLGPLHEVPDGSLPDGARVAGLVATALPPASPLSKLKRAFNSPELDGDAISELFADPAVKTIVELGNLRMVAIEGVDRLVDDIGAALVMFAEGDIADAADTIEAVHANASSLLAELRDSGSVS